MPSTDTGSEPPASYDSKAQALRPHFSRELTEGEATTLLDALKRGDRPAATRIVASVEFLIDDSAWRKTREVAATVGYPFPPGLENPWDDKVLSTFEQRLGCFAVIAGAVFGLLAPAGIAATVALGTVIASAIALWFPMRRGADDAWVWMWVLFGGPAAAGAWVRWGWQPEVGVTLGLIVALRLALMTASISPTVKRQTRSLLGSAARGAMALYLVVPALAVLSLLDRNGDDWMRASILLVPYLVLQSFFAASIAMTGSSSWLRVGDVLVAPVSGVLLDAVVVKDLGLTGAFYELALVYLATPIVGVLAFGLAWAWKAAWSPAESSQAATLSSRLGTLGILAIPVVIAVAALMLLATTSVAVLLEELELSGAIGGPGLRSSWLFIALVVWAALDLGRAVFVQVREREEG